jgi:hypothetical protein
VPRQHLRVIRKRPQFLSDSGKEELVITMREICPPDPSAKEDIPSDENIRVLELKTDRVRRMTGDMEELKIESLETQLGFSLYEMIDGVRIELAGDSHHLLEPFCHGEILGRRRVSPDGALECRSNGSRTNDVVVMLVGQDKSLQRDPLTRDPIGNSLRSIKKPMLALDRYEVAVGLKQSSAKNGYLSFTHGGP